MIDEFMDSSNGRRAAAPKPMLTGLSQTDLEKLTRRSVPRTMAESTVGCRNQQQFIMGENSNHDLQDAISGGRATPC